MSLSSCIVCLQITVSSCIVYVQITEVKTQPDNPSDAELVHTVTNRGEVVPAVEASSALNTLLDQELALELDRVVVTKARRKSF